ncbi:hypothetical protein ABKV19_007061 [Rosa sericea]
MFLHPKMDPLLFLFVLLVALFPISESQLDGEPELIARGFNSSDLQDAVNDMRAKSYYGFAILLQMVNGSAQQNRPLTFFMPADSQLSESPISVQHLEEFMTSHAIPMPLSFNDLLHFPTGSLVPTGVDNKMIRINNRGRTSFYVSNAHIVTPNICNGTSFRCHGIDAVIQFGNVTAT